MLCAVAESQLPVRQSRITSQETWHSMEHRALSPCERVCETGWGKEAFQGRHLLWHPLWSLSLLHGLSPQVLMDIMALPPLKCLPSPPPCLWEFCMITFEVSRWEGQTSSSLTNQWDTLRRRRKEPQQVKVKPGPTQSPSATPLL